MANYVVMSQGLAGFLMINGFKLHKLEKSRKNMEKNVFIFTQSPNLEGAIAKYKNMSKE